MLEASIGKFTYDSANRLTVAGTRYYVYDVEGTRIKTQKGEDTTEFVYNVNARLSQLLVKTENNAVTKYVYGLGLIGEETSGNFKTYHFDYRGSTVAITNVNGTVTDTFEYDTYGKLTAHSGSTDTQFLYNGRDGVMTEDNGLIYMRARYYSTALRRFVNADKLHGDISNALTLNRYSYVNGNPASNVDPEGLCEREGSVGDGTYWTAPDPTIEYYYENPFEDTDDTSSYSNVSNVACVASFATIAVEADGTWGGLIATSGATAVADGPLPIGDIILGIVVISYGIYSIIEFAKGKKKAPSVPSKLKDKDGKVKTPDSHPDEFKKGNQGKLTHKKTKWSFERARPEVQHGGPHWDACDQWNGNHINVDYDGNIY